MMPLLEGSPSTHSGIKPRSVNGFKTGTSFRVKGRRRSLVSQVVQMPKGSVRRVGGGPGLHELEVRGIQVTVVGADRAWSNPATSCQSPSRGRTPSAPPPARCEACLASVWLSIMKLAGDGEWEEDLMATRSAQASAA